MQYDADMSASASDIDPSSSDGETYTDEGWGMQSADEALEQQTELELTENIATNQSHSWPRHPVPMRQTYRVVLPGDVHCFGVLRMCIFHPPSGGFAGTWRYIVDVRGQWQATLPHPRAEEMYQTSSSESGSSAELGRLSEWPRHPFARGDHVRYTTADGTRASYVVIGCCFCTLDSSCMWSYRIRPRDASFFVELNESNAPYVPANRLSLETSDT